MLEIPEAITIANQINTSASGKSITHVIAASSPHKFAWYLGDPVDYPSRLIKNQLISSSAVGGLVEVTLNNSFLLFSDGVNLRYHKPGESLPQKHQLLLSFDDGSTLSGSVQMYGGLSCWVKGEVFDNPYYLIAKTKPSPLNDDTFTETYFLNLLAAQEVANLSMKAALATQQRIPGLGNGVLQDILWRAKLSPRRKVNTLSETERNALFLSLKQTLSDMARLGGRDTEKDLFGNPGGYQGIMSAKTNGIPCPDCGTPIIKEAYLGGSVYYCRDCQKL